VSVVGFGTSRVLATYGTNRVAGSSGSQVSGVLEISAWPPGRFAVSGRAREPGHAGIANVRVLDPTTGLTTMTGRDGGFFLGGIAGPDLTFESGGFETATVRAGPGDFLQVAMQRVVLITAGDMVNGLQLAPHDVSYEVAGDRCFPCRRVRIVTGIAGTLRMHLTWTGSQVALNIWAGGRRHAGAHPELTVDLPVGAGEAVIYLGMLLPPSVDGASDYVPFKLVTELVGATWAGLP
jgi:hypothetical protein